MPNRTLKIPSVLHRAGTSQVKEDGTIRLSISSDVPYKRYDWMAGEDYFEVLDHSPTGMDASRLMAGAALLFNHNRDVQIGTIDSPTLENGRCYVNAKLSKAEDVASYRTRIEEGILKDTSVGYSIEDEGECIGAKDGCPIYKFRWFPQEASLVTIPADITVGVGRQRDAETAEFKEISVTNEKKIDVEKTSLDKPPTTKTMTPEEIAAANKKAIEDDKAARSQRVQKIRNWFKSIADQTEWQKAVAPIMEKHIDGDAEFDGENGFLAESQRAFPRPKVVEAGGTSGVEVVGERDQKPISLGEAFVRSAEYKRVQHLRAEGHRISSLEFKQASNFRDPLVRATFTSTGITGYSGIVNIPQIWDIGVQRPVVADLIPQGTTDLAAVPYMRETSITNAATTVAQAGAKPEATFALTQTSAPVVKIAVTIPVADEAFEDVATLASYIDGRLRWMVETTEEAQLLNGDPGVTASNMTGILNTSGIQTQTVAAAGANKIDAFRQAKNLKVRAVGFAEPNGAVINPTDWDTLQGLKDANNQYFGNGPFTGSYGTPMIMVDRIWGMVVVVTTGITQGTALIGNFRDAMIFRKKGITIDSTNSHASEFVSNITRLRAEERLALAVFRPKSFCTITGL